MRALIATGLAALLVTGCGGPDAEGTIETEEGEFDYSIDASGGNSEFSGQTSDGRDVSVQTGTNVSADLPDGYSLYPGSNVVTASNVAVRDGTGSVVIMTTPDSPEDVAEYYRAQAEAAGISIAMENTGPDSKMLAGEGEGGKSFTLTASKGDNGTTAQLMVGADFAEE